MKNYLFIVPLIAALFFASCKKEEGCTDVNASNFNENAQRDDGSCRYETMGFVKLNFHLMQEDNTFGLNERITLANDSSLWLSTFKFYLSNFTAGSANNENLNAIALIDFVTPDASNNLVKKFENNWVFNLFNGRYTNIQMGLGVVDTINKQDPTIFDNAHPLSGFQNMYWSWNTNNIFVKVEGRFDRNNNASIDADDQAFFVHTGLDSLYRNLNITVPEFVVVPGETTEVNLKIDLDRLFAGFRLDSLQSHTTDFPKIAFDFTENLVNAISEK